MRWWFVIFLTIWLSGSVTGPCSAEQTVLQGNNYWAVLASRQDQDQAIGAAEAIGGLSPKVMHSTNGWYAVVSGPHHIVQGQGRAFLDDLQKKHGTPADTYLSRGLGFDRVVWAPTKDGVLATLEYDGENDATIQRGDIKLEMSKKRVDKDSFVPILTGFFKGKRAFTEEMTSENPNDKPSAQARLVQLDPGTVPDVVFTYYWQGAHCCTVTRIITLKRDGTWATVSVPPMDGDGFALEDIEGHGFSYLVSGDQSFLYAFAPYADSFVPIQIKQLKNGSLVDVTREPRFRHRVLQDVYRQETFAKQQDELRSNGFLAGWVANKLMVDEGSDAWKTMLANYEHEDNGFGVDKCTADVPLEKCPDDKKAKLPFPEGLRQFLVEHGYITDPDRFSVPVNAPLTVPAPPLPSAVDAASPTPPELQRCASEAETVRKLIYQQFLGRQVRDGESYTDVDINQGEITLEEYEPTIRKVTCAASYTFQPRNLIGRLAEDGNMARAATLGRLSRRARGSIAGRVRYTVKPTPNGNNWIEILP